ncbi:MAG: SUMF1/EgtB/PvdO family nonheme iron enzyme [Bacteroidetes bacterium]|nr:SUMF1/EgtB/PvdO family nonheme iron enzyme [Bacteroidota bacterium]
MRNPILLIMLGLSLSSVAAPPKGKHAYWQKTPPGVIRISENYFYDETEVANVHWLEYLYWTKRIFGENSKEYMAALPDQKVWEREDSCLHTYRDVYLKPATYYYYPLVGITQQQAEAFARWRSDRVMERTLILHHVIEEDSTQNRNKYFTVDKYFAGQYKGIKPDTAYMYYPQYRLPTVREWQQMAAHLDSPLYRPKKG